VFQDQWGRGGFPETFLLGSSVGAPGSAHGCVNPIGRGKSTYAIKGATLRQPLITGESDW